MGMRFRYGYIDAESSSVEQPGELKLGTFDVLITAANWDSRSTWLLGIGDLNAKLGIMIKYDRQDPEGRQVHHEEQLLAYLRSRCVETAEIRECSREVETLWRRLYEAIRADAPVSPKRLRICFDITTIPRYCFLAALAGCIGSGLAESIVFLYAEGDYGDPNGASYTFHEGDWRSVAIPFLKQPDEPSKAKYVLVSVGFEGTRTLRVISDEEPKRISVLFPDPGVKPEYVDHAWRENMELFDDFLVPEGQIIRAHAGDAIEAWKRLHEFSLERPAEESIYYLSCGTKSHALALGLRAMVTRYGTALYYIPEDHTVTDVKAAGVYWRYDIRDLSAIPYQSSSSPIGRRWYEGLTDRLSWWKGKP